MRKSLTPKRPTFFAALVATREGKLTGHKIMVPYSSPARFSIGDVEFDVKRGNNKYFAFAKSDIPQSWFIDLSAD